MIIAVEGCCHGELDAIYEAIASREHMHNYKVDLLLICGDFQAIRNEADIDAMNVPKAYRRLGTFHKYYSGEVPVPIPTIFIGGNHEASNYMWELYHGGWAAPGIYFLGYGGVINVGGLRIGGMSGIWKGYDYEKGHYEIIPLNNNDKKSIYHIRKYDVFKMLQIKEPMDVFLSHDWPLGVEQYGDTVRLLRRKPFFKAEVESNTLGSVAFEQVLARLRPNFWFSAHLHVKFYAEVHWNQGQTPAEAITAPLAAARKVALAEAEATKNPDEIEIALDDEDDEKPDTPEGAKNPDEIEIAFDDDDDEDAGNRVLSTSTNFTTISTTISSSSAPKSNPDEIQFDMDDEDEDDDDATTVFQPSTTSAAKAAAADLPTLATGPTGLAVPPARKRTPQNTTKFLALDKCGANREYLEILDFPEITGPAEFFYDEEWLAIVRTLDSYLSTDHTQKKPMQGDVLDHTLQLNREWVKKNVTQKRGLAIPYNFQVTSPIHDHVRTMGPQERYDNSLPFLNPQMEEFCEMLQIPNKINPRGRNTWRNEAVIKEAEEAEAHLQENSIHDKIEDMDIKVEEAVAEEAAEAVEVEEEGEEGALAVHTVNLMTTNPKTATSHSLSEGELTGGLKAGVEPQHNKPRSGSGQGEVYRRIQMSKAPQRGRSSDRGRGQGRERFQSGSRGRGERKGLSTAVKFNRATRLTNPDAMDSEDEDEDEDDELVYGSDMSDSDDDDDDDDDDDGEIGDPDEGLESDEIDESEDQFIMQQFDWEAEGDQDPDRHFKVARARAAAEAAAAVARAAEPFIPPVGWGGALAYQSTGRGDDESSGDDFEEARDIVRKALVSKSSKAAAVEEIPVEHGKTAVKDADQIIESSTVATTSKSTTATAASKHTATRETVAAKSITHVSKKSKTKVDLIEEIQVKMVEHESQHITLDLTMATANDTAAVMIGAEAKAEAEVEAGSGMESEMLWVIDTEPSAMVPEKEPLPQIQETYISLPPEPEFTGRPAKKTHRSKRGGKKLREEEQKRKNLKAMAEAGDGHIALAEGQSEEEDDDMLALEDYLQNTMDPDNPDYFDSFLGSLKSLPSGFGHSNDLDGGLDPDDSDFEEDASEDDSQDDEDFDFTAKLSERRRKRKADELLSGALDASFSSDWPAGAPHGYDYFEPEEFVGRHGRRPRGDVASGIPHGNHLVALTSINDHIKEFVNDRSKVSLELPPLAKALRRRVHLLCEQYNLRSQSVGSGKNRFPVLLRTEKTRLPHVPVDLRKFMNAGFGPRIQAEFDNYGGNRRDRFNNRRGDRSAGNRRDGRRGNNDGNTSKNNKDLKDSARALTGTVVGGTASEISTENVGHRMLAKMGWSPGIGLGASGDGITKPIEAVVRAKRRGLGHE
ncbi:lariat debranching enzyme [Mortierella sp. AD031]|nr:lariat debranching enzyme [Mortierella sp. AD031]